MKKNAKKVNEEGKRERGREREILKDRWWGVI
jgi:hypothetical protein